MGTKGRKDGTGGPGSQGVQESGRTVKALGESRATDARDAAKKVALGMKRKGDKGAVIPGMAGYCPLRIAALLTNHSRFVCSPTSLTPPAR